MNHAPYIARARRMLHVNQTELARLLQVTREHVVRLESGSTGPSVELLERLALIVEKRLLRNVVRRANAARRHAERDPGPLQLVSRRRFEATLRRRAAPLIRLLAHALVAGARAEMEAPAWCALLGITRKVLRGVPPTRLVNHVPVYDGARVGLAMEGALRGQRFREFVGDWSPSDPGFVTAFWEDVGTGRMDVEIERRAAFLDMSLTEGILASEWNAHADVLRQQVAAPK